jgi:hypothetical protein
MLMDITAGYGLGKTAQSIMHMGAAITTALREYRHRHGTEDQREGQGQRQKSG